MEKVRLDRYLVRCHPYYSRSQIKKLIEEGFVLVDGVAKDPATIIHGHEKIVIRRRAPEIPEARPEAIPLEILWEDDQVIAINKPPGLVVHPAPGNISGTVLNGLLAILPWVGLVHRLDKGTSGVMIAAKTETAQRNLSAQFKNRKVHKVYGALAFGRFDLREGSIRRSLGRDRVHRRKFSSNARRLREAVTHFRVVEEFPGLTWLELRPETGRTHQIRVHLSQEGHPIAGDTTYGARSFLSSLKDPAVRVPIEALQRPALHALEISFSHPTTGKTVVVRAPIAPDLREMLEAFRSR